MTNITANSINLITEIMSQQNRNSLNLFRSTALFKLVKSKGMACQKFGSKSQ